MKSYVEGQGQIQELAGIRTSQGSASKNLGTWMMKLVLLLGSFMQTVLPKMDEVTHNWRSHCQGRVSSCVILEFIDDQADLFS